MEQEIFKPIIGYEGLYEISNLGRVKCLPKRRTKLKEIFLKAIVQKDGYEKVNLNKSKKSSFIVHRIVASNFCVNSNGYNVVNHLDGDKRNNKASNLEWTTSLDNSRHAVKIGLIKSTKSEDSNFVKLKKNEVMFIRENESIFSLKELSVKFSISKQTIKDVLKRKIWKSI